MMAASTVLAACLMLASQTYAVPPAVLVGIYKAEGGAIGQEVRNANGSYDLGPMQINTIWLPDLAQRWGVSTQTARQWVKDDPCTNVGVAAWILKSHLTETGSLSQAIAHYHSRTPHYGTKYKSRVIGIMRDSGLIKTSQ
ncbi:MAG: lytic transglycosylase domain-containing protein [Alphaproteobacteria bacterium]|nr:lytic transglycosylase domain-containing protein [Alphaproteobacteria bacterium]